MFIVNWNIFSRTFIILYCFSRMGHVTQPVSAGICLASTHQMNSHTVEVFFGIVWLGNRWHSSVVFPYCPWPCQNRAATHFFFKLQLTSCIEHLKIHSTLTVLLGKTAMRLNNCELWWVLCLKISYLLLNLILNNVTWPPGMWLCYECRAERLWTMSCRVPALLHALTEQ